MPQPRRAAGFSLIEILAVILVISVIVGMILPGLVSTREAANRIECVNNLRQIGLGLQNYHDTYGCLPPGVVSSNGPIDTTVYDLHRGWMLQLDPFMNGLGAAQYLDNDVSVYAPENASVRAIGIRMFLCPSASPEGSASKNWFVKGLTGPWPATVAPAPGAPGIGTSNYAGCHHDVEAPIDVDNHGVFFLNSRIRTQDVSDGTFCTIYVGEKLRDADDLGWVSGTRATLRNTGTPINAPAAVEGMSTFVGGFSSKHPGGANFAFGDCSVRFVRETLRPEMLRLLGHRADGELIDD
jgi:prepilin-type N-terminal cleavage/methylation domain-containing protein/prepilin-type processing-associated H-X9-DG protein